MKRMLLVRWGGLGDLLVALPAIRLLRLGLPSASLTLLGRQEYASLLLQAGVVDEIIGQDDPRALALFSEAASAGDEHADWLDRFDLVVSWMNRARVGVPETGRSPRDDEGNRQTIRFDADGREGMSAYFFRKTLEAMGDELSRRPDFQECARLPSNSMPDDPGDIQPRRPGHSGPSAVIHPGSGGERKRWPLDCFLEIAGRLRDRNVDGAFVSGEAEAALDRRLEAAARSLGWRWLRSPSLAVLARLLGKVDLYLGNDSGITHLAAACGARSLALFRNDLLDTWRPFGDSHIISADSVDGISLESVWRAAAELLCRQ